ncbi:MAG: CAP domain-containing protein [Candidatus Acidiferrales bacterium]|jgi:uncharacterized protein YkwD
MFAQINSDRTSSEQAAETHGQARPLQWDPRLAALARAHSVELANGLFSHVSADGSLPSDRMTKAGIRWLYMGENIAEARDVARAESAMMNEPRFQENHRANILNPNYTVVGVGIVNGPDGMLYITQEFAQLR